MKKYFYIAAVVLFMATCTKNSPVEDEPEEPAAGVITMTTMASEVNLRISVTAGTDYLVIDWGDKESNLNDAIVIETGLSYFDTYFFSHRYSGASEHRIAIIGDNIESLYCNQNGLTALDVSRCLKLNELNCYNNQLTTLDVSRNAALSYLACGGNPLTTLDVSHNTALYFLHCCNTPLTTLDVSQNPALSSLYCYSNQLAALDVSHNTALSILWCQDNQLTTLDVNHNVAYFHFLCQVNLLTTSVLNDIFRTLRDLEGITYVKNITYPLSYTLYIGGNPGAADCDVSIVEKKGWRVFR